MKIAYLVSRYPAVSHTFIQREVRALRSQGFSICIASINETDVAEDRLTAEDRGEMEQTFYVKKQGFFKALGTLTLSGICRPLSFLKGLWFSLRLGKTDVKQSIYSLFYFIEATLVGRWMQKNKIHHIHVHFANPASTVAMILTKIYPFTFSLTIHGPDEFYDVTLHHLKEKIIQAHFICCISDYTRSQVMRLSSSETWSKFEVVPLGIDPDLYKPRMFREAPASFQIVSVGRLTPNKGYPILLQAIHLLKENNVRVQIIGEGPEHEMLERMTQTLGLQDHVIFRGALNQEQTREIYGQADIFVLPSFAEGLPVVLMEAMSMEIPCIASAINGIPELIKDGHNGLLVAPSDSEGLCKALELMMTDAGLRKKLGQQGRSAILERYSLDKNIAKLQDILKKWTLMDTERK